MCFQAEDGIRDLVRSRGLGDVYKRQISVSNFITGGSFLSNSAYCEPRTPGGGFAVEYFPVSYTHLTLPTSDLV